MIETSSVVGLLLLGVSIGIGAFICVAAIWVFVEWPRH